MTIIGKYYRRITKKIDVFGTTASLSIAGDQRYVTSSGGCLSILLGIIIMIYLKTSLSPMVNYLNPVTTYTQSFTDKPGPLNLTDPDFIFAIGVALNGQFLDINDGSYFSFNITQTVCPPSVHEDCVVYNMSAQPCPASFYEKYPQIANYTEGFVCPQNTSFFLTGQPLGDYFEGYVSSYITIILTDCNETSYPGIPCKSQQDIDTAYTDPTLGAFVFFSSTFVNVSNHSTPIQTVVGYTGGPISPGFVDIRTHQYLDGVNITTADSWLTSENHTDYSFTVNTRAESTQLDDPSADHYYYTVIFRRSQNANVYTRRYLRIGDVFSAVGGFARSIISGLAIIVGGYAALKYRIYFANQIYDYKKHFDMWGNKNYHPPEGTVSKRANIMVGEYLIHEINPKVKRKERPNASGFDHLKSLLMPCCFRSTKKGKQLDQVQKKISEDADIIKIVKSLKQFDKLKEVILDADQKLLFESSQDTFYEQPPKKYELEGNLYERGFDEKEPYYQGLQFKQLEKIGDLYIAYVTVFKLNNETNSSRALKKMLDQELIDFMENLYEVIGSNFDLLPDYFINSIRKYVEHRKKD